MPVATIAPTDFGWYRHLLGLGRIEDANFWTPSAQRAFRGEAGAPFLFKLKAPRRAICGFGLYVRYSRLPDWLAWECFGQRNGCASFDEMRARIGGIRSRMNYRPTRQSDEIGCIVVTQPTFFAEADWIPQPRDWPERSLTPVTRELDDPEWQRVWNACLERAAAPVMEELIEVERFGAPRLVRPRLGQGAFRVVVTEAYERACAVTEEHSLPALEAAHIKPYGCEGTHAIGNGLLLRADLHRLFDHGYLTFDAEHRLVIGNRLRDEFSNGRSYYPLHGRPLRLPSDAADRPDPELLAWHRETLFRG